MRILMATIFVCHCAGCLFAQQLPPLTVKEISLMLRSGYSSETILRDLSVRHFAGTFDPATEEQLRQSNASSALIDALKSGNNAASEEELAKAHKRIADAEIAAKELAEQDLGKQKIEAQSAAAQKAAIEMRRQAATRAEANLDARVINALSAPVGLGGRSPDQQRVYDRARAIAETQFPVSRVSSGSGTKDENNGERQKLIQQLTSDEGFVRDTLSR
jgi:hypothetical protein